MHGNVKSLLINKDSIKKFIEKNICNSIRIFFFIEKSNLIVLKFVYLLGYFKLWY